MDLIDPIMHHNARQIFNLPEKPRLLQAAPGPGHSSRLFCCIAQHGALSSSHQATGNRMSAVSGELHDAGQ